MRTLSLVLPAAVLAASFVAPQPPPPLVITGARVLDVEAGRYQAVHSVVIEGDRIAAVHVKPPAASPPDARVIRLDGATLVPGLADMHAYAAPGNGLDVDFYYALSLAHGVTMMRTVGARLLWAVAQRERVTSGDLLAPRTWTGGPALEPRALADLRFPAPTRPPLSVASVSDSASMAREVEEQVRAGVDWISVRGSATLDAYRAIIEAAHAAAIKVSGEALATSMVQAAQAGVDVLDGLGAPAHTWAEYEKAFGSRTDYPKGRVEEAYDYLWAAIPAGDLRAAAAALTQGTIVLVPLLGGADARANPERAVADRALDYLPERLRKTRQSRLQVELPTPALERARRAWQAQLGFVRDLAKAGGRIAIGSGTKDEGYPIPGAAVHAELARLVEAGLTPAEAIRAATMTAAEALGAGASLGQITAGFGADLFAVEGDPLQRIEDLGRIVSIVRGGDVLDRAALITQARRATGIVR